MPIEITRDFIDELTFDIIGCAIEVHKNLGPGLLESVYQRCFEEELKIKGFKYLQQFKVPVKYKGIQLNAEYRLDFIIEDLIIVELKAMDCVLAIHKSQLLTYMRLLNKPKGVLINFNCRNIFKEGQYTLVNDIYANLP